MNSREEIRADLVINILLARNVKALEIARESAVAAVKQLPHYCGKATPPIRNDQRPESIQVREVAA
jgi:hypothetical protein